MKKLSEVFSLHFDEVLVFTTSVGHNCGVFTESGADILIQRKIKEYAISPVDELIIKIQGRVLTVGVHDTDGWYHELARFEIEKINSEVEEIKK